MRSDDGRAVALGGQKPRAILGVLLLNLGRPVPADEIVAGVWEETATVGSRQSLRTYLSRLRGLLTDPIRHAGGGYLLDVAPDEVDAHRFEAMVAAARDASVRGPAASVEELQRALELWRGRPYDDVADLAVFRPEVDRLGRCRLSALEDRIEADLALGHHRAVAEELAALVREHPFRERLWAMRMLALYRDGLQADALETYARVRRILADELGVDPGTELRELHDRILRHDPALQAPAATIVGSSHLPRIGGLELRRAIGTGPHGTVHRAFQASLGREVAVKVIRPDLANDRRLVRRFADVTRRWTSLDHPNVLDLVDAWRTPDAAYLVFPLQEDRLELRLARRRLHVHEALRIVDETAQAVAYLHRHELAHGAVTVSNVLLDDDGHVRLADCGTARLLADPDPADDLVALGALVARLLPDADPAVHEVADAATRGEYQRAEDLQRDLRRAVGSDVVALALAVDAPRPVRNPFKGLRPFQVADADDYFGRDVLVASVVQTLGRRGFVTLVGPSGSGKSSLVRAGVVPALRKGCLPGSDDWFVADLFPGRYPFESLLAALRSVASEDVVVTASDLAEDPHALLSAVEQLLPGEEDVLLLVVDQLEEVFAVSPDTAEPTAFLEALTVATTESSRVKVLVTLRGDAFEHVLSLPVASAVTGGCVPVGAPPPSGLAEAITLPADRAGLIWEPGLVDEIVSDVRAQPGSLPLLQYACTELVERREGRVLTRAAYGATGGVAGALQRRAEEAYQSLAPAAGAVAEAIFLRLVTVRPDGHDVRRRVHRSELETLGEDRAALDAVIETFGRARILTFDRDPVTRGGTVEIAHDALLVHWPRLREWVRARREDIVHRQRLQEALREWREAGGDTRFLLPAPRLAQYEEAARHARLVVTDDERDFLAASRARVEADERSRQRRHRRAVAALATLGVITSVVALVALQARRSAEDAAHMARVRELATSSRASVDVDPELAVLLALEAVEVARRGPEGGRPVAVDALQLAVAADRVAATFHGIAGEVSWSRDGSRVAGIAEAAAAERGPRAVVLDAATGEAVMVTSSGPPDGAGVIRDLALSPDGTRLVTTFLGGAAAAVWDVDTGRLTRALETATSFPRLPTISDDGRSIVVTNTLLDELREQRGSSVSIFDLGTGSEVRRVTPIGGAAGAVLSPDGSSLAVASPEAGAVWLYDLRRPGAPRRLDDLGDQPHAVAWSPSGTRIAALGVQGTVAVWDAADGTVVMAARAEPLLIEAAFVTEGRLVIASSRGRLDVWDVEAGLVVDRLRGHHRPVYGLDVRGGRYVAAASADVTKVFDLDAEPGTGRGWATGTRDAVSLELVPDPPRLAVAHVDGSTVLVDAGTGAGLGAWTDLFATTPVASVFALVRAAVAVHPGTGSLAMTSLAARDPERPRAAPTYLTVVRALDDLAAPPQRLRGAPLGYDIDGPDLFVDDRGWVRVLAPDGDERARTGLHGDVVVSAQGLQGSGLALMTVARTGEVSLLLVDTATGERIRSIPLPGLPQSKVGALATTVGGTELAVGVSGEVLLLDIADLPGALVSETAPRFAVEGAVTALAYASDDRLLVVGTDRGLEVWDRSTLRRAFTVPHDGPAWDVAVAPGASVAFVTGPGGSVRSYLLDADELARVARAGLSRGFTDDECARYLGGACPPDAPGSEQVFDPLGGAG